MLNVQNQTRNVNENSAEFETKKSGAPKKCDHVGTSCDHFLSKNLTTRAFGWLELTDTKVDLQL